MQKCVCYNFERERERVLIRSEISQWSSSVTVPSQLWNPLNRCDFSMKMIARLSMIVHSEGKYKSRKKKSRTVPLFAVVPPIVQFNPEDRLVPFILKWTVVNVSSAWVELLACSGAFCPFGAMRSGPLSPSFVDPFPTEQLWTPFLHLQRQCQRQCPKTSPPKPSKRK